MKGNMRWRKGVWRRRRRRSKRLTWLWLRWGARCRVLDECALSARI